MATQVGVHVLAEPGAEAVAHEAITACLEWFREVDVRLSRFTAESELSRLNAAAGSWQTVSPVLFDALAQSVRAAEESDGLFDPTLLTLIEALGYDRDFSAIRHSETRPALAGARSLWVGAGATVAGGWRAIELDAANRRVRLPFGVRLDLGGIAKGWAADVALERFFAPSQPALINVGGDMRARGGPETGGVWPIGLGTSEAALDADPTTLPVVTLGAGGLAVSGARDRWWYQAGRRQHHLIDPRTGRPAQLWIDADDSPDSATGEPLIMAVAALAPTAAHAEVAAKVAIMQGYPLALRSVERAWAQMMTDPPTSQAQVTNGYGPAPVALILTLGTGELVCSQNLSE
ncbi:MAG TPA: FAD:protein FMN transferase [Ktedonobacterales bacterium]|nr:FAD:protein FMN transferase [Ktedonobacterales bacterium]